MPLFVAAVVAARRGRRPSTITVAVNVPSLWRMLLEEAAIAIRTFMRFFFQRSRLSHSMGADQANSALHAPRFGRTRRRDPALTRRAEHFGSAVVPPNARCRRG